jgi:hypothetical protein
LLIHQPINVLAHAYHHIMDIMMAMGYWYVHLIAQMELMHKEDYAREVVRYYLQIQLLIDAFQIVLILLLILELILAN